MQTKREAQQAERDRVEAAKKRAGSPCQHPGWEVIGVNELGTWSNCTACGTTKVEGKS